MWCEIINNGGILALVGVIVGFLLSEISGIYKKHNERKDAKNSLYDEIRFNQEQTKKQNRPFESSSFCFKEREVSFNEVC